MSVQVAEFLQFFPVISLTSDRSESDRIRIQSPLGAHLARIQVI
jgi:hypothetical protein